MSIAINFKHNERVQNIVSNFSSDRTPLNKAIYYVSNKLAGLLPTLKKQTYVDSLKERISKADDIEALIDLSILEELKLIDPLAWDTSEVERQFIELHENKTPITSKIAENLMKLKKPILGSYYTNAVRILERLKDSFPSNFDQSSFEWLVKTGKVTKLSYRLFRKIEINDSIDFGKYTILTFGCGHRTEICSSKKASSNEVDAHENELTVDLRSEINPDIKADFRNPKLFDLLPKNQFKKIWFENMHLDPLFRKKSYQGCFDILKAGGKLKIGGDTSLLRKPYFLDPEKFFKELGFSKVIVKTTLGKDSDRIEVIATK